jgi:NAD(P)-dependent dehydrogenase (short-subunit alcohol dehydrogenase family)
VLLARRTEHLERIAAEISAEWEACDVSDRAQVDEVAARVLARHPSIGLLVNNAGVPARGSFLDVEPDVIERAIRINYLGSVWCLRAFAPGLHEGAHVVNLVSVAGTVAFAPAGAYAASKHAQLRFLALRDRTPAPRAASRCTRSCRGSSKLRGSRSGRSSAASSSCASCSRPMTSRAPS